MAQSTQMTLTLAQFASDQARQLAEGMGSPMLGAVRRALLDHLGCVYAGWDQEPVVRLRATLAGASSSARGTRDLLHTALIQGASAHVLEFDDSHQLSKTHPGAPVWAALLSLAMQRSVAPGRLLAAAVVGYEVTARTSMALGVRAHRRRGWHATGTCGTLGAAAAAGVALGFDPEQLAQALSLAVTQTSGTWAFASEGSMEKCINAGKGAMNGLLSALLVEQGFQAATNGLDAADGGFLNTLGDGEPSPGWDADLGRRFAIQEMTFKPYPCCRTVHPAIDAALLLRSETEPGEIQRVHVYTYDLAREQNGSTRYPANQREAQFSLPYTVAAALQDGRVTLEQFQPERLQDPELRRLHHRVEIRIDPAYNEAFPRQWPCRVEGVLADGRVLVAEVQAARGDPRNPLSDGELQDKFRGCLHRQPAERIEELIRAVDRVSTDLGPLLGVLEHIETEG